MEIQDLTYDNLYRKPVLLPERPPAQTPQESETFRPAEGIIELSLSNEINGETNSETPSSFERFPTLASQIKIDGAPSIEDLRLSFEANSAELSGRLQQFFSTQGIQAPIAANMTVDSQGRVVVSGDFEQRGDLEAEFSNDPEFNALFTEISASASLLRAADAADDFAKAHERNPEAALKEYAHLFSDTFKFNARFEDAKLSASFESSFGPSIAWWQET